MKTERGSRTRGGSCGDFGGGSSACAHSATALVQEVLEHKEVPQVLQVSRLLQQALPQPLQRQQELREVQEVLRHQEGILVPVREVQEARDSHRCVQQDEEVQGRKLVLRWQVREPGAGLQELRQVRAQVCVRERMLPGAVQEAEDGRRELRQVRAEVREGDGNLLKRISNHSSNKVVISSRYGDHSCTETSFPKPSILY